MRKGVCLVVGVALLWPTGAQAEQMPTDTWSEALSATATIALQAKREYEATSAKTTLRSRNCPTPGQGFRCRVNLTFWNEDGRTDCAFFVLPWRSGWKLGDYATCPRAIPIARLSG